MPEPENQSWQQGTCPVLIVSPAGCNELAEIPIAVGGRFARRRGFAVLLEEMGTRTMGVFRCDQPRTLDLGAWNGRHVDTIPEHIMDGVLACLATLFE